MEITSQEIEIIVRSLDLLKREIINSTTTKTFEKLVANYPASSVVGKSNEELAALAKSLVNSEKDRMDKEIQMQIEGVILLQAKLIVLKSENGVEPDINENLSH